MTRTKVFISYSHRDDAWRKRVALHLDVVARQGVIEVWDDRKLHAGTLWFEQVHEQMLQARIAVILVSSWFLTSDFILDQEVPRLFDRHEKAGMTIYPLLLRPCPWKEIPWLARMQLRPEDGRPVASYRGSKVDEVLVAVALEIASIARGSALTPPPPDRPKNAQLSTGQPPLGRATVTQSSLDEEDLILRFLAQWPSWGFNAARIRNWGGRQPGFERLASWTSEQIQTLLDQLNGQGKIHTFKSRSGRLLCKAFR